MMPPTMPPDPTAVLNDLCRGAADLLVHALRDIPAHLHARALGVRYVYLLQLAPPVARVCAVPPDRAGAPLLEIARVPGDVWPAGFRDAVAALVALGVRDHISPETRADLAGIPHRPIVQLEPDLGLACVIVVVDDADLSRNVRALSRPGGAGDGALMPDARLSQAGRA
ncbi:MAG: hypothetical protein HYX76_10140 [Acidobacteria bacterium]|nr:hypothetical protein [Acidobacteriota bacterium]